MWSLFEASHHKCVNETQLKCKNHIFENELLSADFLRDYCLVKCPLECNQTDYGLTLTSSQLVKSEFYAKIINENRNLSLDRSTFDGSVSSRDEAVESFVYASIFYEKLSYSLVTESPKMDVIALLASMGGNLSLFMGLSVFSLCELVEILIEIYYFRRK